MGIVPSIIEYNDRRLARGLGRVKFINDHRFFKLNSDKWDRYNQCHDQRPEDLKLTRWLYCPFQHVIGRHQGWREAPTFGGGVVQFSGLGGGDHRNLIKSPMKTVKRWKKFSILLCKIENFPILGGESPPPPPFAPALAVTQTVSWWLYNSAWTWIVSLLLFFTFSFDIWLIVLTTVTSPPYFTFPSFVLRHLPRPLTPHKPRVDGRHNITSYPGRSVSIEDSSVRCKTFPREIPEIQY